MTSAVYDFKAIKSQVKDGDWWKPAKDEVPAIRCYGEIDASRDNDFAACKEVRFSVDRARAVRGKLSLTEIDTEYYTLLSLLADSDIPDRLSVERDDPGYVAYANMGERGRNVTVMLDGIEQQTVVTADRAEGWVKRMSLGVDGKPAWIGDSAVMEVVHGKVEFTFKS